MREKTKGLIIEALGVPPSEAIDIFGRDARKPRRMIIPYILSTSSKVPGSVL